MRIIYTFLLLSLLFSCKKSDIGHQSDIPNPPINVADSFYVKAKINGNQINWIVPSHKNDASFAYISDAHYGQSDYSVTGCVEGYCYYMIAGTEIRKNIIDMKPRITVGFNMATNRMNKEEFMSWFSLGIKSYAPSVRPVTDLLNPAYNGVYVYYVDQNGNDWSTMRGLQQGSTFESVLFIDETRTDIQTKKVWKAKFSCKLYDNLGNFITVENGEILGPILLP